MPPKVLGIINDGFMRYVADLGNPASTAERRKGPPLLPGQKGAVPGGLLHLPVERLRTWVIPPGFDQAWRPDAIVRA